MAERIDRRDALGRFAAAGITVLAAPLVAREQRDFALRYVLASSLYGKTRISEILPEVRKTGSEAIDIWPRGHADQREQIEAMGHARFLELLKAHRVRLGMITRYDLGPYRLRAELEVVRKFGGQLIVCGAGRGEGKSLRDQVRSFLDKMKPQVEAAERADLTIGIENHSGSLLKSPDAIRHFAELAVSERLGLALAPYHLPQNEALLAKLIEDLGPKLVHFYAWQYGKGCHKKLPKDEELLQMPGRGQLDFSPLLAALEKIGYRGWTEIFMHPVPRGIPILETTAEVTREVNRARAYLERSRQALSG